MTATVQMRVDIGGKDDSSCSFVLKGRAPFELATAIQFSKVNVNLHSKTIWFAERT